MLKFSVVLKLTLLISVIVPIYCARQQFRAVDSIEGFWQVTEIRSHYGRFSNGGYSFENTVREEGVIGSFSFSRDMVEYTFTRNDTVYEGTSPWSLDHRKVQSGFSFEDRYTLVIGEEFVFDVTFGGGTRKSEKDAQSMTAVDESVATVRNSAIVELDLLKE